MYLARKLVQRNAFTVTILALLAFTIVSFSAIAADSLLTANRAGREQARADLGAVTAESKTQQYAEHFNSALRQNRLAWFLAAWKCGRIEEAKQYWRDAAPESPEKTAMEYLLDPSMPSSAFAESLGLKNRALMRLIVAERAAANGDNDLAILSLKQCIETAHKDPILHAAAVSRLKALQGAKAEFGQQTRAP